MSTAVLAPPEDMREDYVTLGQAASVIGRTLAELNALLQRPIYRATFPEKVAISGRQHRVRRADVIVWAVEEGLAVPDGSVMVGYIEISAMLGYVNEQSARALLTRRNGNIQAHGEAKLDDIPEPYAYYGQSARARPMWLREDIVRWAKQTGRLATDGSPQRRRSGGWTPSPDAVTLPAGRPGQRRRR